MLRLAVLYSILQQATLQYAPSSDSRFANVCHLVFCPSVTNNDTSSWHHHIKGNVVPVYARKAYRGDEV